MTRATSTAARAGALVLVAAFLTAAVALSVPDFPFDRDGYQPSTTIYPGWVWVFVVAGIAAALASAVTGTSASRRRGVAPAVAFVAAAQLAGNGLVAYKHWQPIFGYGNIAAYGDLDVLEPMAAVLGIAGLVASLTAFALLFWTRQLGADVDTRLRALSLVVGLVVIAVLPFALRGDGRDMTDLTTWGTLGLLYAGPWGLSIIVSGWLPRGASIAVLVSVGVSVVLTAIGPQLTAVFIGTSPTTTFVATLAAPLLVLVARAASRADAHSH